MSDVGITVAEAAQWRLAQIKREIDALLAERLTVQRRLTAYRNSRMLESERLATAAEPYQRVQLPE